MIEVEHSALKVVAAEAGVPMYELIAKLIREELARRGRVTLAASSR